MKKFTIQVILLLLVIGGGLVFYGGNQGRGIANLPFLPQPTRISNLKINDHILKVIIADTQSVRSKGLGGRQSIASDEGMLFIFDKESKHPFWMKGLTFPLDFIWVKGDIIVDLLPNIPQPAEGQDDKSLPIYTSIEPVDKVLEVNAGVIKALNIKVGDKITILP